MCFQGGTGYLAGTLLRMWPQALNPKKVDRREQLGLNWTYMLDTAIDNLHKCLWFGLLEEKESSMELLRYQTGLQLKNKMLPHFNRNKDKSPKATKADIHTLQKLMPLDIYLYKYAQKLFERRWQWYQDNVKSKSPRNTNFKSELDLPPVVTGCTSTAQQLHCPDGQP